jgi:hypothetical protein
VAVTLFLDTEFNGFGGRLMSLALVPDRDTVPEFYKELTMNDQLHPWVKENVVPHLIMVPCSYNEYQNALAEYLWNLHEDVIIVADWPDDIKFFCESLITGPGMMINMFNHVTFQLELGLQYESKVPHNALHDARGIKEAYLKRMAP